jgi:type II secretory pathway pseudopilin PulG
VELLFTLSLLATITAIAIPLTSDAVNELRAANAVRYLEGRIMNARMEAVKRSRAVALRFEPFGPDYIYGAYVDANGNGVRTADIGRGVDWCLTPAERLGDKFPGVTFGLTAGIPDLDGSQGSDGIRIGTPRILTMTANGTATSGTLYVKGKGAQYAVRVLGATGRTRVFRYDTGVQRWIAR